MAERYDAIVVGGDLAAGTVALALTGAQGRVLCVDPQPGVAGPGGLVWPAELAVLRPEVVRELPAPSPLVEHRWQILSEPGVVSVDYRSAPAAPGVGPSGWLDREVARSLFARTRTGGAESLAGVAERVGTAGSVAGVVVAGEERLAPVVIVSEGAIGGDPRPPDGLSVTYRIGAGTLQNRFAIRPTEAVSLEAILAFLPEPTRGVGFLEAHGETVTVGVFVRRLPSPPSPDLLPRTLDRFLGHPGIAGYVAGTSPEGPPQARWLPRPLATRPEPAGLLRIGRSAGLDLSAGPISTGPGFTIRASLIAAEAVREQWAAGEPTRGSLARRYGQRLRSAGIPRELALLAERSRRVAFQPRLHHGYPPVVHSMLHRLMTETGGPKEPVTAALRATRRAHRVSPTRLALDALDLAGSL